MKCQNCNKEFDGRQDAKYCSTKCRKEAFQKRSISVPNGTDNVERINIEERIIEDFQFTIVLGPDDKKRNLDLTKKEKRTAKYWYQVPLCGVPVVKEGWPRMPEYMNGRQYFLWWKNGFKVNEDKKDGEIGMPIIFNPYPKYDKVEYIQAGEQSRRWGS